MYSVICIRINLFQYVEYSIAINMSLPVAFPTLISILCFITSSNVVIVVLSQMFADVVNLAFLWEGLPRLIYQRPDPSEGDLSSLTCTLHLRAYIEEPPIINSGILVGWKVGISMRMWKCLAGKLLIKPHRIMKHGLQTTLFVVFSYFQSNASKMDQHCCMHIWLDLSLMHSAAPLLLIAWRVIWLVPVVVECGSFIFSMYQSSLC